VGRCGVDSTGSELQVRGLLWTR